MSTMADAREQMTDIFGTPVMSYGKPMTREALAVHEAAHATAACYRGVPFRYVTIRPAFHNRLFGIEGIVQVRSGQRTRYDDLTVISAAGPIAEARFLGVHQDDDDLVELFGAVHPESNHDISSFVNAASATAWCGPTRTSIRRCCFSGGGSSPRSRSCGPRSRPSPRPCWSPRALTYREVKAIAAPLLN